MSYDVGLKIQTGPNRWAPIGDGWNYTSNMGGLFRWAYGETFGQALEDKPAQEVSKILSEVINKIEKEPIENLDKFNAPNGWGDWRSFLLFLSKIKRACDQNPYCKVGVWY